MKRLGGLWLFAGLSVFAMPMAFGQPKTDGVAGITIDAKITPIRWLGMIPTRAVKFDVAIYVDRRVKAFSSLRYECFFIGADGSEIGRASGGVVGRDAFTVAEDGRLVARAHEEMADNGQSNMRCRATRLDK